MEEENLKIDVKIVTTSRGKPSLIVKGFKFMLQRKTKSGDVKWFCHNRRGLKCEARCTSKGISTELVSYDLKHNHESELKKYVRQAISNSCKRKAVEDVCRAPIKLIIDEMESSFDDEEIAQLDERDILFIRRNIRRLRREAESEDGVGKKNE